MSVTLRPMDAADYEEFVRDAVDGYVDQLVDSGGWTPDEARAKADADFSRLLPDGLATEEQHLTMMVDDASGQVVGGSGSAPRAERPQVPVGARHLGAAGRSRTGNGRAGMLALEDEARRLGHAELRLNVFGHNDVARGLYRSLGYAEVAVEMQKQLEV